MVVELRDETLSRFMLIGDIIITVILYYSDKLYFNLFTSVLFCNISTLISSASNMNQGCK